MPSITLSFMPNWIGGRITGVGFWETKYKKKLVVVKIIIVKKNREKEKESGA